MVIKPEIILVIIVGVILIQCSQSFADNPPNTNSSSVRQIYPLHTFKLRNDSGFEYDGKEIVLAGGTMHYFRIPREHWEHRLEMLERSGLNTVFTAIEWSTHEPREGEFRFTGEQDFIYFIRIAEKLGLKVILRPGPFIGEERDFGGYPSWLLWQKAQPDPTLTDQDFKHSVAMYFRELLPRLKPLLADHGGPVIMLEITEEAAASPWLMKLFRIHLGNLIMFRTYKAPGPLRNASSLVSTLDGWRNASLRTLGNSWSSLWRGEYQRQGLRYFGLLQTLVDALNNRISIGLGAFHTGTDFGFKAGAVLRKDEVVPYSTEDVDALLGEDGSVRSMYPLLQTIACSFFGHPIVRPLTTPPVKALGSLLLWPVGSLLDERVAKRLAQTRRTQESPATFEELRQGEGFVLYATTLKRNYSDAVLHMHTLRDRAQVYVDGKMMGVASRGQDDIRVSLGAVHEGALLQILVESLGRPYWGAEQPKLSFKGLSVASAVVIDRDVVTDWTMLGLPFDEADADALHQLVSEQAGGLLADQLTEGTPLVTGVDFEVHKRPDELGDTFLDMRGWGRGVAFLNGHNLGRYWPDGGTRKGLYVPRSYLRPAGKLNHLAVLELEAAPARKHVIFRIDLIGFRWMPMCNVAVGMLLILVSLAGMLLMGKNAKGWTARRAAREAKRVGKEGGEGTSVET